MKKLYCLFIALCALLSATILYAAQIPIKGYVTPNIGLNVRTGPNENSTKIGALEKGTTLKIVAVSGTWYKISSPMSGYVHAGYVNVTEFGEAPDEDEDSDKTDDESTLSPEEAEKVGCNIKRSLNNSKVTKAPQQQ